MFHCCLLTISYKPTILMNQIARRNGTCFAASVSSNLSFLKPWGALRASFRSGTIPLARSCIHKSLFASVIVCLVGGLNVDGLSEQKGSPWAFAGILISLNKTQIAYPVIFAAFRFRFKTSTANPPSSFKTLWSSCSLLYTISCALVCSFWRGNMRSDPRT